MEERGSGQLGGRDLDAHELVRRGRDVDRDAGEPGAGALGDIGSHFPDTDVRFKGADSVVLLRETGRLLAERGLRIGNIDSTVIAQAPKLAPFIPAMRECLAGALGLDVSRVNVKAKTAEKLGPVGQGLSMEARAVALLF